MKKIVILSLLGLILLAETSVAGTMKATNPPDIVIWVKLTINFHRPKLNCEKGFGVCFMFSGGVEALNGSAENNYCPARGMINEKRQLVIEVEETALNKYDGGAALPNFKDKTSITIPDPYSIPESTCRALGSQPPLTIKAGTYPISYKNGVYTVVFQL